MQKIPNILHYCWFGEQPKSAVFQQCLESWKQFAPHFEIKEWNEETSTPFQNKFYHDALRKGKYAFAADVIRVRVLYEMGGIYLDTDMLLVKPIDALRDYSFFTGYEVAGRPAYGFFGAVPQNHMIEHMRAFYDTQYFNSFSPPVITHTFKDWVTEENLREGERIFPPDYFYPLPYEERDKPFAPFCTQHTLAVHLWDHSWKVKKKDNLWELIRKSNQVVIDYLFYEYPFAYFKRYTKEFVRKIVYKLVGKKT
ncbi:MAG: glycosyltransferase [Flavobacteriaceae bacterium]